VGRVLIVAGSSPDRGAILKVAHASKTFGATRALDDVSLEIESGEIHGLVGHNGSGKSTLIKILAGLYPAGPTGEITVGGHALGTREARDALAFVHQDLALAPSLTILDNLRVGRYRRRRIGPISWRAERQAARRALDLFELDWPLDRQVASLGDTARALLAIARAAGDMERGGGRGLLVLDEPTVYLPGDGVDRLFRAMRTLAHRGHAVLFVTHQLSEVREVTDRVTVLRDGRVAGSAATADLAEDQLAQLIVGRAVTAVRGANLETARVHERAFEVADLEGPTTRGVSFELGHGEIVGLTGLVGAGFDEIPYLLYGAVRAYHGTLSLPAGNCDLKRMTPRRAQQEGIALVPANRQRDAVFAELSVQDNLALPALGRYQRPGGIAWGAVRRGMLTLSDDFDVRPRDINLKMRMLSGGNQQKAVLAKWLQTDPRLLLTHEPTQGVDVGARAQIHQLIRSAAARGTTVVVASSEYEDLPGLCDRVIVFTRSRPSAELAGAQLSVDALHEAVYASPVMAGGPRS
jgi:ribose transport system ATP-binding protein